MIDELELALSQVGVCQRWTVSMAELAAVRGRAGQWAASRSAEEVIAGLASSADFKPHTPCRCGTFRAGFVVLSLVRFPVGEHHGIVLLNGGELEAPQCRCACRWRTCPAGHSLRTR